MMQTLEKDTRKWLARPIGEKLQEAGLISPYQIEVALIDQTSYIDTKFGEILALRGWLKQETVDFFVRDLPGLINQPQQIRLGDYFKAAALLEEEQITEILREQIQLGIKFGYVAVIKGYLKQETLDFFLRHFVEPRQERKTINQEKETVIQFDTEIEIDDDDDAKYDIRWIN